VNAKGQSSIINLSIINRSALRGEVGVQKPSSAGFYPFFKTGRLMIGRLGFGDFLFACAPA